MKTKRFLAIAAVVMTPLVGLIAQPAPGPDVNPNQGPQAEAPVNVSPAVAEIVNLAESGTSEQQILARIQSSPGSYSLGADDVIYLKDVGLSSTVINAMLSHGGPGAGNEASASRPPLVEPDEPRRQPQEPPLVTGPYVPQDRQYADDSPPPVVQTAPPQDASYFYRDLAPYGTWVQLDGVGFCWQPRAVVVNRSWQPYCDSGHWVWTDAGWFWQSDYSWGWAPFHYGRWQLHDRCGWVWLPDRTWGPSWVVWRTGGDYCGWAPCPPGAFFDVGFGGWRYHGARVSAGFDFGLGFGHFTFIGLSDFGRRDYGHYRISSHESTRIYNNTTVINNYTVVNNRVVNHGVPVDRVSRASHTEFRQVAIRDVRGGATAGERVRGEQGTRSQAVYRHELRAPEKIGSVPVQRVDANHPIVHQTRVVSARDSRSGGASFDNQNTVQGRDRRTIKNNNAGSSRTTTVDRNVPGTRGEGSGRTYSTPTPTRTDERRDSARTAPLTPGRSSDTRRETSSSLDSSQDYRSSRTSGDRRDPVRTAPVTPYRRESSSSLDSSQDYRSSRAVGDRRDTARTAPVTPDRSETRSSRSEDVHSRYSEPRSSYQPKTYSEPRSAAPSPRSEPRSSESKSSEKNPRDR